jgi:hypothetical protein
MAVKTYAMGNFQGQRRMPTEEFMDLGARAGSSSSTGRRPVFEAKAHGVQVAVWRQERQGKDGTFEAYSVSVSRRYKDKEGNWQSSSSFDARHIAALRSCLARAEEFLLFGTKEMEEQSE